MTTFADELKSKYFHKFKKMTFDQAIDFIKESIEDVVSEPEYNQDIFRVRIEGNSEPKVDKEEIYDSDGKYRYWLVLPESDEYEESDFDHWFNENGFNLIEIECALGYCIK